MEAAASMFAKQADAAMLQALKDNLRNLLVYGSAIQHHEENQTMSHKTHTASLINAKLFDKGIRDALAGMTTSVEYVQGACMHPSFQQVTIRATKVHDGRRLQAQTIVDPTMLDDMREGHYAFGKSIGFELALHMLKIICESQPQEITISIKDASKARDMDNKDRMVKPYGGRPEFPDFLFC